MNPWRHNSTNNGSPPDKSCQTFTCPNQISDNVGMYNKANVSVYPVNKLLNEKVKHHKHCNKQNDYNISIRSNIITCITSIGTLYSPDSNNNFFKI